MWKTIFNTKNDNVTEKKLWMSFWALCKNVIVWNDSMDAIGRNTKRAIQITNTIKKIYSYKIHQPSLSNNTTNITNIIHYHKIILQIQIKVCLHYTNTIIIITNTVVWLYLLLLLLKMHYNFKMDCRTLVCWIL